MAQGNGDGAATPRSGLAQLERLESLEQVSDEWDALAEGAGHPFASWEWISAWWQEMGEGRELYSFVGRDEAGQAVVILPLYVGISRPVRVARFIGYGDLASPLCRPEHRPLAAEAISGALGRGSGSCRLLLAENLPPGEGWNELLKGRVLDLRPDPVIGIDGADWEEYLASKNRRFRKLIRQQERRLEREFELTYRLADDSARIDEDIDLLFRLHDARWGEQTTGVFIGRRGAMQRAAIKAAQARGWLRLWVMELDGRPVAADLAWRWQGSEWGMNCGRDAEFDEHSVGAVLMAHAVREACNDSVPTYRLLQGASEYKLRYATDVPDSVTMLVGSGLLGALGSAGAGALVALPESMRARLMQLLG